ncbi:hypothetical protein [Williamsia maris]|uniref:Glycosyltransferase involved in cell wall bisynthesis n=1 Tax=Williamsia maris TaxID=72806 RepID=A0ABT1HBJ7_9NOCA|nr:hypothetical protein [Williamsia maris]MCP2175630.1 Glycosyltransferase involved in cell wall bisynthesis [Williamsia maris]
MTPTVCHVIVGPRRHGVVRHAMATAAVVGGPVVIADDIAELRGRSIPDAERIHIHFTDRLFGATATLGADEFVSLTNALDRPVSATLHDVPQPSDGHAFAMRVAAYRRVIDAVDGVVVSSDHERTLLADHTDRRGVDVIPLALDRAPTPPGERAPTRPVVGVLGFIYPGKGHAEIIEALGGADADLGLLALGAVADGHEDMIADLTTRAADVDVAFETTGFVPDTALEAALRSVAVPVAFHRHLSASASINTWIEAGRRPLVPRNRYTAEIEADSPGVLWLHGDSVGDLRDAIARAAAEPELTWVADDVVVFPSSEQVAAMYRARFDAWSRR